MNLTATRKLIDRAFTSIGAFSILLMTVALAAILLPMLVKGAGALVFQGTIEHRKVVWELFERGDRDSITREIAETDAVRAPVYEMLKAYKASLASLPDADRRKKTKALKDVETALRHLLGPIPGEPRRMLVRDHFGATRWDRAQVKLSKFLYEETRDYSDPTQLGHKVLLPRVEQYRGTALEPAFAYVEKNLSRMLLPRWTFYWRFLTDDSRDSHFFGGIWPELLGTFYLTLGAMLFAVPIGVISAIYLVEYAHDSPFIRLLRSCVSTLAGVPSIVFGLFGLAFFINSIHVSHSKSVLAGSLTLGLLILPTVIRSSEESLRAVPKMYKEAALSLGASTWKAITTVILPAALPGILTGIVISMGRAAGETAPIIFTAAVSVGKPLKWLETLTQPTPALSWNIYNLATEHEAVDEIRHVQYGMVFVLVGLVLLLNLSAIVMRARLSRKLRI
ncbi:MAG TPA: phosphate ABC transporter permease PstA [Kiritimatiellia bacterium]|nr:phosphate ABC transporter permease PstA [Kiritimatiellia bacterium]